MNTSSLTGLTLRAPWTRLQAPASSTRRQAEACNARDLCVLLHDVSPARWEGCLRVLAELGRCADRAGVALPLTLLVVPRLHGDDALPARYLRWLHGMAAAGHELCLHGLTHRDDGERRRGLRDWLLPGMGEFAALERDEAQYRLQEGRAWARALGFTVDGFAAPAWQLSPAALQAVASAGFTHTCTADKILALPQRRVLDAPGLALDSRRWWLAGPGGTQDARLLRLELHPGDADDAGLRRRWTGLLDDALRTRVPVRLGEAAQLAGRLGRPA